MGKDTSVAPKERINITYVPATGDQQEQVELPLKLMVVGDFTGRADDRSIEERDVVDINKDNFNEVMAGQAPSVNLSVPNTLSDEEGDEMSVELDFNTIRDFEPENIARNVPELNKMLELREALVALKGPLGNVPAFRKKIRELLDDEASREQLLTELNIAEGEAESSDGDDA